MSNRDTPAESIRIVVQVPQPHREPPGSLFCPDSPSFLFFAWLHWMLVHAAGLGGYLAFVVGLRFLAIRYESPIVLELAQIAGPMLTYGCPVFIASLEGMVLRRVGLAAPMWVVCQGLSLMFGFMLAIPLLFLIEYLGIGYSSLPLFCTFAVLLALGAGMGLIQLSWLELNIKQSWPWWISTGLAPIAAVLAAGIASAGHRFDSHAHPTRDIPIFAIAGAAYGVVSGWGVVHALRRQQALQRQLKALKS